MRPFEHDTPAWLRPVRCGCIETHPRRSLDSNALDPRALRTLARAVRDDERGAGYLAAFIVLFSVLVVAGVGILVDSARIFSADRQCTSIAFEAARAGANAIDADVVRGGGVAVDPAAAAAAAQSAATAFVSGSGATLQSVSVEGDTVTVVVSAHVDSWFPIMSDRTVTERATARIGPVEEG